MFFFKECNWIFDSLTQRIRLSCLEIGQSWGCHGKFEVESFTSRLNKFSSYLAQLISNSCFCHACPHHMKSSQTRFSLWYFCWVKKFEPNVKFLKLSFINFNCLAIVTSFQVSRFVNSVVRYVVYSIHIVNDTVFEHFLDYLDYFNNEGK